MKSNFLIFLFVAVLALIPTMSAEEMETVTAEKQFVLNLAASNFSETVSKHDFMVVAFVSPRCGRCVKFAPEYESAASILSSHDPPLALARVDVTLEENQDLKSKFEVKGYPSIRILRDGGKSVQEYKGPRETDGIVEYTNRQNGPASAEIKSLENASDIIGPQKITIVGIFPEFFGQEFENFIAIAKKLRAEYDFRHTLNAKYLPGGDLSVTGPIVRLFKPFDELFNDSEDFDIDALEKFFEESNTPLIPILDGSSFNQPYVTKFHRSTDAQATLILNLKSDAANSFNAKYRKVAEKYKGNGIVFLIADVEVTKGLLRYFGLKEEQVPLIILKASDQQKFLKTNIKPEHIAPWLKEFKDGELKPYLKSEPVPEENNEPIKVVVADSFQDMFLNSPKSVLLVLYAPRNQEIWEPILDEIAAIYESDSDVVLMKMNAYANDAPSPLVVQGYPTVYFKSASGKLVKYDGEANKEDILDFIEYNRDKANRKEEPAAKDEL